MENAGKKISKLRKAKGINQRDFAKVIGVSQPSLIKFERGETDIIPLIVAIRIAEELSVNFFELYNIKLPSKYENEYSKLDVLKNKIADCEKVIKTLNREIEQKDLTIQSLDISRKALIEGIVRYIEEEYGHLYWKFHIGYENILDDRNKRTINEMVAFKENKQKEFYDYFLNAGLFSKKELEDINKRILDSYKITKMSKEQQKIIKNKKH